MESTNPRIQKIVIAVLGSILIAVVAIASRPSNDPPPFEFITKYHGRKLNRDQQKALFPGNQHREIIEIYQFDADIYTLNDAIIDERATRATFLNKGKYAHVQGNKLPPENDPDPAHTYVFVYQSRNWVQQRLIDFQEWINPPKPGTSC